MMLKMRADLKTLLSPSKFVPIYISRKDSVKTGLGPFSIELHWTSLCNYKCVHCSYGERRSCGASLSAGTIKGVIRDLVYLKTKSVYISGGGEPTLMKDWDRNVGVLLDNEIEVAMITNGALINNNHLDLVRRLNYIAISVYSSDEKEYKAITGSSHFKKQFTIPASIKSGRSSTVVGARCVINKVNYKNVFNIYMQAMDAGYDYIIFIPAIDYENRDTNLTDDESAVVRNIAETHYDEFDMSRTNLDSLLQRDIRHYAENAYMQGFLNEPLGCAAIEVRGNAFINYDGGVYICQPHINKKEYCIGSLNKSPLRDIWNSAKHQDVIKRLNRNFLSGNCSNCRSIAFNREACNYSVGKAGSGNSIIKDNFI